MFSVPQSNYADKKNQRIIKMELKLEQEEVREILEHNDIIELKLTEKKTKETKENGKIESLE